MSSGGEMGEDKQEQNNRPTEQQSDEAPWSQTGAGAAEAPDQGQPSEDSSNEGTDQTGEGTGAKAGEYS
jgi:hypothetical protein